MPNANNISFSVTRKCLTSHGALMESCLRCGVKCKFFHVILPAKCFSSLPPSPLARRSLQISCHILHSCGFLSSLTRSSLMMLKSSISIHSHDRYSDICVTKLQGKKLFLLWKLFSSLCRTDTQRAEGVGEELTRLKKLFQLFKFVPWSLAIQSFGELDIIATSQFPFFRAEGKSRAQTETNC